MRLHHFELTTHDSLGQATCSLIFHNSISNQTPAQLLGDLPDHPVGLGLPRQPLQLKATWSMEDVFTIVFTLVDDTYKKLFLRQSYFRSNPNADPVFTDSELITLTC